MLDADGGTRTAAITGAFVAAVDAIRSGPLAERAGAIFTDSVAAVSVGIVDAEPRLDLEYVEDSAAGVDMNLVATGSGRFVEVQGTGETVTFSPDELQAMLGLGMAGIRRLTELQRTTLGDAWPLG